MPWQNLVNLLYFLRPVSSEHSYFVREFLDKMVHGTCFILNLQSKNHVSTRVTKQWKTHTEQYNLQDITIIQQIMQKINSMPWIKPCDRRVWPAKHVSTLHQMPGFRRDDPFPKSVLPCHQKHYNCGNLLCLHNVEWQEGVCAVFSVFWLLSTNLCKHSWLGDQQQ